MIIRRVFKIDVKLTNPKGPNRSFTEKFRIDDGYFDIQNKYTCAFDSRLLEWERYSS